MALYACVLAKLKSALAIEAAEHLVSHQSVGLALPTTGPYDLLLMVKAETPASLGKLIIEELQAIVGVESTLTLFILDEFRALNWLQDYLQQQTGQESKSQSK